MYYSFDEPDYKVPETLIKSYKITACTPDSETVVYETDCNYQRLRRHKVNVTTDRISITPLSTWGDAKARIFSIDVL